MTRGRNVQLKYPLAAAIWGLFQSAIFFDSRLIFCTIAGRDVKIPKISNGFDFRRAGLADFGCL
jgi:hypothetical protein